QGEAFLMRLSATGDPDTKFGSAGVVAPPGYSSIKMVLDAGAAYLLVDNDSQPLGIQPDKYSVQKFITFTPNVAPVISIDGGNRNLADTDGVAGEIVSVSGTATDSDRIITSTQWLVGGVVVATGTSAAIALNDGSNLVSFKV